MHNHKKKKHNCQPNAIKSLSNSKVDNITISFLLHFLHYYFGSSHATLSLSPRSRPTIMVTGLHFKGPFKKLNPNLYKSAQSSPLFLFLKIFVYFMLLAFASFCSLLLFLFTSFVNTVLVNRQRVCVLVLSLL